VLEFAGLTGCIIVDSSKVTRWHHAALADASRRGLRISTVMWCENTRTPKRPVKHAAYYGLRLGPMRSRWTASVPWSDLVEPDTTIIRFDSEWDGAWQRVPSSILAQLAERNIGVTIKLGMYLLRDPQAIPSRLGVLSFHHGDPSKYRGRPAGFYEMLDGADSVGAMVQRLNNKLDGGEVLAFGSYKLTPHSYRQVSSALCEHSAHLLSKAIRNAQRGVVVPLSATGKNYRLPSNATVGRFVVRVASAKAKRLWYGITREKRWEIAKTGPVTLGSMPGVHHLAVTHRYPVPAGYSFVADPSVLDEQTVLCEGMNVASGLGQVLILTDKSSSVLDTSSFGVGHFSYPFIVHDGDDAFLLPEMETVGPQRIARLDGGPRVSETTALRGLESVRLIDPTVIKRDGTWWLFAGTASRTSAEHLYLWFADGLSGPYTPHPDNPIVIDPSCARNAGPIVESKDGLFRLGQDNRGSYGDGVVVRKITALSRTEYRDEPWGELRMNDGRGPHTVVVRDGYAIVDWYAEAFNPMAWLVRLKGRFAGRAQPTPS
jgi:hypothetical protein